MPWAQQVVCRTRPRRRFRANDQTQQCMVKSLLSGIAPMYFEPEDSRSKRPWRRGRSSPYIPMESRARCALVPSGGLGLRKSSTEAVSGRSQRVSSGFQTLMIVVCLSYIDGRNQIYIPSTLIWEKSYSLGHATLM